MTRILYLIGKSLLGVLEFQWNKISESFKCNAILGLEYCFLLKKGDGIKVIFKNIIIFDVKS